MLLTDSLSVNKDSQGFGLEKLYFNRELSWLDFANRLLDLACDSNLALLERTKFLAIFSQGIDEFFQVRVAGLKDQLAAGVGIKSPDGASPREQLGWIREKVNVLLARQDRIYNEEIVPELSSNGIVISSFDGLDSVQKSLLLKTFEETIFPVLTPLAVDPGHPFPYISALSLNLAVSVKDTSTGSVRFSRVKVPPILDRYLRVTESKAQVIFVPIEEVIAHHLSSLFPGMEIGEHYCFRVTRNVDLSLDEDEAEDLLAAVEVELQRRRRGRAVRLEIEARMESKIADLLVRELELDSGDIYRVASALDLSGLWEIFKLEREDLKVSKWVPVTPRAFESHEGDELDIFRVISRRDHLVHHPYESFPGTVEEFIDFASRDPQVLAIKQTLYRTSRDSPIVKSLIKAAESGKQVAVLVELKARFDEERNIEWARALEKAGVHVVYGLVGLKTHAKTALVIRAEEGAIRRYCHIGSGNYNPSTAQMYEDVGLLSSSDELGSDLGELFNFLTGYSKRDWYKKIIVAPNMLKNKLIELIRQQSALGDQGYIAIKVNGLSHPEVIDELYLASRNKVQVNLIVRGICTLRPGVADLSETIHVRSIVGRFLEHSRIFCFGQPDPQKAQVYIGSADLMERNLEHRVEVVTPIEDISIKERLLDILQRALRDDMFSWELSSSGQWNRNNVTKGFSSQGSLMETARENC